MPDNRAIVDQKTISDAVQPFVRLKFIRAKRLVAQVAARRHHRKAKLGHEQVVQRIRRQHDAEIGIAGSHRIYDLRFAICDFSQQHIGASGESNNRSSSGEISQTACTPSNDGNISANGFSSRCFRSRKS